MEAGVRSLRLNGAMGGGRNSLRSAIVATLAASVLAAAPAAPDAHKRSFLTSLSGATKNKNFFHGELHTAPECLVNRPVSVFDSNDILLGTTKTDGIGNWQLSSGPDIVAGAYSARMPPRRLLKNRKHRHICRGADTDFQVTG